MHKIRLAVIGTGMAWERLHYPALQKLSNEYEIVALSNRTKVDAQNFATKINLDPANVYEDYREMLKRIDIDVVDILVPIEQNYEVSEVVARAGKNIICEKPLAPNLEQARKYLELSSKYNIKIMIAENFRYNEENNIIKSVISSGKIGNVLYFIKNNVSSFLSEIKNDTFAAKEWRQHPIFPGGAFLDAAVHDMASIHHIFDSASCVQAFGTPQKEDYCPYSTINANILFKNSVIGQYIYCPSISEPQRPLIGFRIFGTLGQIFLEEKSCGIINIFYQNGSSEQIKYTPEQGFYNELMNFYKSFNNTEQISVTPEIEFGDVKMIFNILESIEKRKIVYVDEQLDYFMPITQLPENFETFLQ